MLVDPYPGRLGTAEVLRTGEGSMGAAKAALRRRLCLIHQMSRAKNHHKKLLRHSKLKGLPSSFIARQFVLGRRRFCHPNDRDARGRASPSA